MSKVEYDTYKWYEKDEIAFGRKLLSYEGLLESCSGKSLFLFWYSNLKKRKWWYGFDVDKVITALRKDYLKITGK